MKCKVCPCSKLFCSCSLCLMCTEVLCKGLIWHRQLPNTVERQMKVKSTSHQMPKYSHLFETTSIPLVVNSVVVKSRVVVKKIYKKTRMHSSRMRTGHSLTVCWSLLPGGGVSAPGGCLLPGAGGLLQGVSAPGGCLLLGGGSLPLGVSALGGGVCSWGCLLLGGVVSALGRGCGVCSWEGVWCLFPGVVCSGGCLLLGDVSALGGWHPSMHWGRHPHLVDRITDACENITLAQLRCGR